MAEDDIYGSKARYESLKSGFDGLVEKPVKGKRKYYCKNPANVKYFSDLARFVESRDLSYVRRCRLISLLLLIVHNTDKDLKDCKRDDVNGIMAFGHTTHKTIDSKKTLIKYVKFLWRVLLPVLDEEGLIDEQLVPHPVRHLTTKVERAKQKARKDKLTYDEFESYLGYFSQNPCMQLYLMLSLESLGRPQEICYRRIEDCEIYDNYAKIQLTDHTKSGIGILQCIDSYPYLMKWLNAHPQKHKPEAWLFLINGKQLTPETANRFLKKASKGLGIKKPITCYSLKRNGVTFRRLRGDSDIQIQHAARWTSTQQLKTYDQSNQEDALQMELRNRGLTEGKNPKKRAEPKQCEICNHINPQTSIACENCYRPLDRTKIQEQAQIEQSQYDRIKHEIQDRISQEINKRMGVPEQTQAEAFIQTPEIKELYKMMSELQKVTQHVRQ